MTATVSQRVHFAVVGQSRRAMRAGPKPPPPPATGPVPRVARLMALAVRLERLIAEGVIADQTEIAQLGHVTTARVSQILALNMLAPDIQEAVLDLPEVTRERAPITERDLRPIAGEVDWGRQRALWRRLRARELPAS